MLKSYVASKAETRFRRLHLGLRGGLFIYLYEEHWPTMKERKLLENISIVTKILESLYRYDLTISCLMVGMDVLIMYCRLVEQWKF